MVGTPDQTDSVLEELTRRGLLFVDARIGQWGPPHSWNRSVDIFVDDDSMDALAIDDRLGILTSMARDNGSALGLVSVPRPVTVQRIAAWSKTLSEKGLILAPVSALVLPSAKQKLDQ